jgi:hypothetical protein
MRPQRGTNRSIELVEVGAMPSTAHAEVPITSTRRSGRQSSTILVRGDLSYCRNDGYAPATLARRESL